jgi:DNA-binding MarR family transcriptional regulator
MVELIEDRAEEQRIRATASRYAERFPWLSAEPIEAYISLLHTMRVHIVAIERYLTALGQPKPISSAQHTVLRTLYLADGHRLSQNEITREIGVSPSNITNLVDVLEREGMVSRSMNPGDRRANYIQLTEAGVEFCAAFIPAVADFMALMFEDLSDSELAHFKTLLARVRNGMYRRHLTEEAPPASSDSPRAGQRLSHLDS